MSAILQNERPIRLDVDAWRAAARRMAAAIAWSVMKRSMAAERARQRRALAALDDRLLQDIGLTRADAARESAKPGWR